MNMQLIHKLAQASLAKGVISKEDVEIYEYGVVNLLMAAMNYGTFFLIAVLTDNLLPMTLFFCAFKPLRTRAGGLHLKTRITCYATSTLIVLITSFMLKSQVISENVLYSVAGVIVSYIIILILAPVQTQNKPLDKTEVEVYGFRTKVVLHIEMGLCVLLLIFNNILLFQAIAFAIIQVGIILLSGWVVNQRACIS